VLKVARFKRPSRIQVHGMLTVNGEKMSKSRGTFINARQYTSALDPSYLRYFYAANLGSAPEDLDLSLNEFRLRVNADLAVMTGNVAQVFVADDDWHVTLEAVSSCLRPGGWFVFETRRPEVRDWESWTVPPTTVTVPGAATAVTSS
jgi:hypothetical protein